MNFFILTFTLIVSCNGIAEEICTPSDIEDCNQPIEDLWMSLDIIENYPFAYFPVGLNDTEVDQYCIVAKQSCDCLTSLDGCSDARDASFEGLSDGIKYLCDENVQELKDLIKCARNNPNVESNLVDCGAQFDRSNENTPDEVCRVAQEHLDCIRTAWQGSCGKAATDVFVTSVYKTFKPHTDLFNCTGLSATATTAKSNGLSSATTAKSNGLSSATTVKSNSIWITLTAGAIILMF